MDVGSGWVVRYSWAVSLGGRTLGAIIEEEEDEAVHPPDARRTLTSGERGRCAGKRYRGARTRGGVSAGSPPVDIHRAPRGLDDTIDWFDAVSHRLVLLEEYSIRDVERAVARLDRALADHLRRADAETAHLRSRAVREVLQAEHAVFATSLVQLRWFLAIVEADDHGGHRQALGQYGRVLAEALRAHRADERGVLGPVARSSAASHAAAPGKP